MARGVDEGDVPIPAELARMRHEVPAGWPRT
jgi:hypothetical protein